MNESEENMPSSRRGADCIDTYDDGNSNNNDRKNSNNNNAENTKVTVFDKEFYLIPDNDEMKVPPIIEANGVALKSQTNDSKEEDEDQNILKSPPVRQIVIMSRTNSSYDDDDVDNSNVEEMSSRMMNNEQVNSRIATTTMISFEQQQEEQERDTRRPSASLVSIDTSSLSRRPSALSSSNGFSRRNSLESTTTNETSYCIRRCDSIGTDNDDSSFLLTTKTEIKQTNVPLPPSSIPTTTKMKLVPTVTCDSNDVNDNQDPPTVAKTIDNDHSNEGVINYIQEEDITDKDVLCARGGQANNHPANRSYLELVKGHRMKYQLLCEKTQKKEKRLISQHIVNKIKNNGGRFLAVVAAKKNNTVEKEGGNDDANVTKPMTKLWYEVDNSKLFKKVSQALREGKKEARYEQTRTTSSKNRKTLNSRVA